MATLLNTLCILVGFTLGVTVTTIALCLTGKLKGSSTRKLHKQAKEQQVIETKELNQVGSIIP